MPPADELRIEDFLAAFDDLFPAASAPLALHLNAGPAPFGEPGLQLLQVGLRAGGPLSPDPATGAPRVVARGATLTVTFNPQVVQAYRLVGHATTTLTGPVAAVTKVDLTAGAELAGLFELWLKPAGGDDVATVDLVWHDPAGGARRHMTGRVSRPQFAKSFVESAASLQAVALAAETARALRSHAAPGRGLGRVLDLATQVQPQLRTQRIVWTTDPVGCPSREGARQSGGRCTAGRRRLSALTAASAATCRPWTNRLRSISQLRAAGPALTAAARSLQSLQPLPVGPRESDTRSEH